MVLGLDSAVSSLVIGKLGQYVEGINKNTLNISLLSGEILLKNPALRTDGLDALEMPIAIEKGFIGELNVKIPWAALKSERTVIRLKNLFALVTGRTQLDDEEKQQEKVQATKQRLLQLAEIMSSDEEKKEDKVEGKKGYFAELQDAITNNIQIEIENVHIRYQSTDSHGTPFAFGITLENFSVVSSNDKFVPMFVPPKENAPLYKIVSMKNCAVYWIPNADHINHHLLSTNQLGVELQKRIFTENRKGDRNRPEFLNYIVEPINFELKLTLNPKDSLEGNKILHCVCDKLSICLGEKQFSQIVHTSKFFRDYSKSIQYIRYRPSGTPTENPLEFWKYIIRGQKMDSDKKLKFRNWTSIMRFIKERNRYIILYARKKLSVEEKQVVLTEKEKKELEDLEWKHDYEDLILFRLFANAYYKENKKHIAASKQKVKASSSFFSVAAWTTPKIEILDLTPTLLSGIQYTLFPGGEDDTSKVLETFDLSDQKIKQKISFELKKGIFTLKDSTMKKILEGSFSALKIKATQLTTSAKVNAQIGDVKVVDFFTKGTKFPNVVEPLSNSTANILSCIFDMKPMDDENIDYRISASMEPLNIVVPNTLIKRCVSYFATPLASKNSFADLELAASMKFEELSQQTHAQFKEIMSEHKVVVVNLNIAAPNIIVPRTPEDPLAPILVLVLGRFSLETDLESKYKAIEAASSINASNSTQEDDAKRASDLFLYKKFGVSLDQIHAFFSTAEKFRESLNSEIPHHAKLIDKFDVKLSVDYCRAHSDKLPLVKLKACLPEVKGYLNSGKITDILLLADSFGGTPPAEIDEYDGLTMDELLAQMKKKRAEELREEEGDSSLKAEEILVNEKLFEALFSIPNVNLFLEDDRTGHSTPMLELQLKDIEGFIEKTSHDQTVNASLGVAHVIDFVEQKGEQFKYLATSEVKGTGISECMSAKLVATGAQQSVKIGYYGIPASSPLFNGLEHKISADFGLFHIMVNLETIEECSELLNVSFANFEKKKNPPVALPLISSNTDSNTKKSRKGGKGARNGNPAPALVPKKKVEVPHQLVEFHAVFQSLGVTFPKQDSVMMEVSMNQSSMDVNMSSSNFVHVEGKLGAVTLDYNNNSIKELYPHIMDIQGEELIVFKVDLQLGDELSLPIPIDAKPGTLANNGLITLDMSSIRFTYIQEFIEEVVAYFIKPPTEKQLAKRKEKEKEKEKAATAASVVRESYFAYIITIHNPILKLPRSKTSVEGLEADLGKIRISNRFCTQQELIREEISISISKANLFSGLLDSSLYNQALLENTDIHLSVIQTRNDLSHTFPGMEVAVHIPSITINLSEYQLKVLRSVLEDNVSGEMVKLATKPDSLAFTTPEEEGGDICENLNENGGEEEESVLFVDILVNVRIQEISANLILGNGYDIKGDITPLGTLPKPLDRTAIPTNLLHGELDELLVHVDMHSNSSMDVSVDITDIFLQDARQLKNENKFRDIFTTKMKGYPPSKRPNFQLTYRQDPSNYQTIEMNMYQPSVIAVADVWVDVLIFLMPFNEQLMACIGAFTSFWADFSPKLSPAGPKLLEEGEGEGKEIKKEIVNGMHLAIYMINSTIYILEDSKDENSSTLLMRSDLDIIYSSSDDKDVVMLTGRRLEVRRSNMGSLDNSISLISPFTVNLQYTDNRANHHIYISLALGIIHSSFTYHDTMSLQSIANGWMPELNRFLDKDKIEEGKPKEEEKKEEEKEEKENEAKNKEENEKPAVEEILTISTGGMFLVLVDDSVKNGTQRPLLSVHLENFTANANNWSNEIRATAESKISIDNYNSQLEVWEPMLEPWETKMKYSIEGGVALLEAKNLAININITKSFVEAVLLTLGSIDEENKKVEHGIYSSGSLDYCDKHPFMLSNQTGIPLSFATSGARAIAKIVQAGKSEPVSFNTSLVPISPWEERVQAQGKTISVKLDHPDFEKRDFGLPIDRIGRYKLEVTGRRSEEGSTLQVGTFEILSRAGDKILEVRSNVLLCNDTGSNLDLLFSSKKHKTLFCPFPDGATIPAPILFIEDGSVQIVFQGNSSLRTIPLAKDQDKISLASFGKGNPYFLNVQQKHEKHDKIIRISAPVILENYLPVPIHFSFSHNRSSLGEGDLLQGEIHKIINLNVSESFAISLDVPNYGKTDKPIPIDYRNPTDDVHLYNDRKKRKFGFRLAVSVSSKIITITVYCDLWIVNRLGLPLLFGPARKNEISAGLENVETKMASSKYRGLIDNTWYSDDYPTEKHMHTSSEGGLFSADKVHLRVANSNWSEGLSFVAGAQSQMNISAPAMKSLKTGSTLSTSYLLAITVKAAPNPFWRTKKVIIMPRYRIWNNTDAPIYYMQKDTNEKIKPFLLQAQQLVPFHLPKNVDRPFFRLTTDPLQWNWSGAIAFSIIGEKSIKLRKRESSSSFRILSLSFKLDTLTGSTLIEVSHATEPDYKIVNKSNYEITVRQRNASRYDVIKPKTSLDYAWDDYKELSHELSVSINGAPEEHINIDIYGAHDFNYKNENLIGSILPETATNILTISLDKSKASKNNKKQKRNHVAKQIDGGEDIWKDKKYEAHITVQRIGISVVNEQPREILFTSISDVTVTALDSESDQSIEISVGRFQIDNQSPNTRFPVALWPVIPVVEVGVKVAPFFHAAIIRNKMVTSVMFIRDLNVGIGQMELSLDESFLTECLAFSNLITDYMAESDASKRTIDDDTRKESEEELQRIKESTQTPWYFKTLQLNPISIILTLNMMDGVDREDLNRLVGFGRTFCNIDRASFQLAGLISHNTLETADEFVDKLTKHYISSAMSKVAIFLGGAEIFGSPISLVSNLGTGVSDFITEPAQGFLRSPADFGAGVAKGTTSLIKNTTVGIFNTTSKFTGAMASGTAALTFDDAYRLERDKSRVKETPKHAGQGIAFGAKSFGKGLFQGITGVVSQPIRGGMNEGFTGAMKGIAKGATGVIIKPAVGAIDSVSKVSEGIMNTAKLWDEQQIKRDRLPRYIGADKTIMAFNEGKAEGQELVHSLEFTDREFFHFCFRVKDGTLLTTDKHVIMLNDNKNIQWEASIRRIRGCQLTNNHIVVYLKEKNKSKLFQVSSDAKFIYQSERSSSLKLPDVYEALINHISAILTDRRLRQL